MKDFKVTDSIFYTGVDDTTLDLFEGQYKIPDGISYNSYCIMDDKITIMDTVDKRMTKEWLANLNHILQGREPDYLVISHLEPDHSANIQLLAETYPKMKLVGNQKTFTLLPQFFDFPIEERKVIVAEGDVLDLGKHKLQFFMAPMVHWPEVMVTYEQTEEILFSADGFGKFGALAKEEEWTEEARRYYFNIVGKYGAPVQQLLKKAANLKIRCICPLHGPILEHNLDFYLRKYDIWSRYEPEEEGVFIAYNSIYGNTRKAVEELAEQLKKRGAKNVILTDLARDDMAKAVSDAFCYDKMIVAATTYDAGIFPAVENFLRRLKHKNYQNRKVGIIENGSWAPMAAKNMRELLEGMQKIEICEPIVSIPTTLKGNAKEQMDQLIEEILK